MIVPAGPRERESILQGDEGFLVEEDGYVYGYAAFTERGGGFYVHTVHCQKGFPELCLRLRREARKRGWDALYFHVTPSTPFLADYLARWLERGLAEPVGRYQDGIMLRVAAYRR